MIVSMALGSGGENTDNESISTVIAETIANHKGVDPADIEPLYTTIDSDALDALFAPRNDGSARTTGQITFIHAGYEITVNSDRTITVELIDEEE
ncbi:HalOD1 output domain-containing protein [Haladaptatus sp. DYF46]|uniref:HalOD1 output domain-containing protein n=1 Tax=Haladaptatus sp. DYF46 TaxID=2886041 RepID=UPI001E5CD85B|nr:HalOD1 output domain-containing protein [Haladaptatus sp. DYF46]